jgi:hypothetical protein
MGIIRRRPGKDNGRIKLLLLLKSIFLVYSGVLKAEVERERDSSLYLDFIFLICLLSLST